MSDYTEMIKTDTFCKNINELLQQGTIIPKDKTGINIYALVITSSSDLIDNKPECVVLIDKNQECVVFGGIESRNDIPREGTLCMFCKTEPAIHSVKKMESTEGQFAGWHYCADCKTKY